MAADAYQHQSMKECQRRTCPLNPLDEVPQFDCTLWWNCYVHLGDTIPRLVHVESNLELYIKHGSCQCVPIIKNAQLIGLRHPRE